MTPHPVEDYLKTLGVTTNYHEYLSQKTKIMYRRKKTPPAVVEPVNRAENTTILTLLLRPNVFRERQPTGVSESGSFRIERPREDGFNFSNIGGYHDVKQEMMQIYELVREPERYQEYGVRVPKGMLLEGPPGNGKTIMVKGLAGETNTSIIVASGSEFNEKYVGVGASKIRELFEFAKQHSPVILFIDEIDGLCRKRSADNDNAQAERDQTLNQLLVCMDGYKDYGMNLIIGSTNRADILDKAVLRPGRFDKIIHVPNPDRETRSEILHIHGKKKPLNVSHDEMVRMTQGMSGAQIENLLNEAVLFGIRNKRIPVEYPVLDQIRHRMLLGVTTKKKNMSTNAMRRVAIHETGHLLMAIQSPHHEKPEKISIANDYSKSYGFVSFDTSDVDEGLYLREYLEDKIKILLGGRAAEEVIFGSSISSGAISDLEGAFELVRKMIMEYGMGNKIIYPYFSEEYKKAIDEEIHHMIAQAYRQSKKFLENNRGMLLFLAAKVMEKRSLYYHEVEELLNEFAGTTV
jgi:cell division protease FtsH